MKIQILQGRNQTWNNFIKTNKIILMLPFKKDVDISAILVLYVMHHKEFHMDKSILFAGLMQVFFLQPKLQMKVQSSHTSPHKKRLSFIITKAHAPY